ncbi:unnamed protein product [Onchocerca ochengi]|uniref:Regulator of Vps4 activity in the MVB pathway protein n=1 Tax=Onchocerca ochengi TaxID=42157 RepID=A0A182DZA4_ONCOC|nr:unnamed protein product [Onchocerca ochengi]
MADMELRAFEAHLDTMIDQLSEESTELIIERPRYAHAVMVFASGDEPGELLTASRIKMLDPIYVPVEAATNGHQIFHHYSEDTNATSAAESANELNNCSERDFDLINAVEIYDDDDIQKALRKLEKSRSMLDEPIISRPTNTLLSNSSEFDYANDSSPVRSKTPQAIHLSTYNQTISERYASLKEGKSLFPSQLRRKRRTSPSSTSAT